MRQVELITHNAIETKSLAAKIMSFLKGGDVILLTGDLSFKINYELDLKQFEIKIPINLSLDSIILLVYLFQCYIDKKINVKELLNQPFLSKYYADFTDLDIKSVSEYIKDEYLVINISNNNKIYSIITKQNIK